MEKEASSYNTPGDRVRKVRKAHNWTQEQLAEAIGLQPNHVSMIENGKRGLTIEKAKLIAELFPPTRYQYLMCADDFETPLHQLIYRKAIPFMGKLRRRRAVENMFSTVDLTFDFNCKTQIENMDAAVEEAFLAMEKPDAYLIKLENDTIGYCSKKELDSLLDEIFAFAEFKIQRLCERGGAENG